MSEFEALNYAFRKSKDGVIVSFVVHPDDVTPELTSLKIGARVSIKWHEIGDDEKPVASGTGHEGSGSPTAVPEPPQAPPKDEGPHLVQQCAIACADARFQQYLRACSYTDVDDADSAALVIRERLGIKSRAELATNKRAANEWKLFYATYQNWLTDLNYGAVRR